MVVVPSSESLHGNHYGVVWFVALSGPHCFDGSGGLRVLNRMSVLTIDHTLTRKFGKTSYGKKRRT